jgi:Helitron helicase-like domain at N-terminus/AAA domain
VKHVNRSAVTRAARSTAVDQQKSIELARLEGIVDSWPSLPSEEFTLKCCSDYVNASTIKPAAPCVCCGRAVIPIELITSFCFPFSAEALPEDHTLHLLRAESGMSSAFVSPSSMPSRILDGLMIHHEFASIDIKTCSISLSMCPECDSSLKSFQIPRFSLKNNLWRGKLPSELHDMSWIEEKICALHRVTADVARLHNAEQDEKMPFRMVGNTCAHPANVPSTANILPRTPADINGHLTVVFVGKKFDKKKLPPLFRVRRRVIEQFLRFLALHNPLYKDVPISDEILSLYPDDDLLPGLADAVIVSNPTNPVSQILQETASFEDHPAHLIANPSASPYPRHFHATTDDKSPPVLIESTGVVDFSGSAISGHSSVANAVYNLLRPRNEHDLPDLILPRGRDPIGEYDNPNLLPGMFPTLFPFGTGGLEADRPSKISFQEHVNYLLSLHDPAFKHHRLFLFVSLNILKRRKGHLLTAFTVRKPAFRHVADLLANVTAETLESTARHLQRDGAISEMSSSQKDAFECLKQLNIVSANLPGSPGAKIRDRACMRGYFGIFGLPHIYFTSNPAAVHSPILQVFFGDTEVDLAQQFPSMPLPEVRAKRLAQDPVAAADFFVFCIKTFFHFMLGYDMDTKQSTGGILGHVKAYYGKCECTNRGCLHSHFVIWLLGGLNPREVHEKLEKDPAFSLRFFKFWEAIIKHDAPYEDLHVPDDFDPRSQRPPPIGGEDWSSTFDWQVKACAEKLQRHVCQEVCWKYKNVSHLPKELRPCRFQYPHEIVPESHYDASSKSIIMACHDPTMNYYNPHTLVYCRHNHDIKNILSGKSAKAAMFYITNYITKDELHSHNMLSMMSQTIAHMKEDDNASPVDRAKARLQRWLSQLARWQEVHAQLAVLYIRGTGDTFSSHETVPMLSSVLLAKVKNLFPEATSLASTTNILLVESSPEREDGEEDDAEEAHIPLRRSDSGDYFIDVTQVDDYLHRSNELQSMSFLEFVCCMRKEKKRDTKRTRLGSYARFLLGGRHPQVLTHVLVQHQDPHLPLDLWKTPPRIVGMQLPRRDHHEYSIFMLAHFKPFSADIPPISPHQSYSDALTSFQIPPFAKAIMQNWEDIHECEDERDAERVRKKQNATSSNEELNARLAAYQGASMDDEDLGPLIDLNSSSSHSNSAILQTVAILKDAGWFASESVSAHTPSVIDSISHPSLGKVKEWMKEMKAQEENMRRERMNKSDARTQADYSHNPYPDQAPSTFTPDSLSTRSSKPAVHPPKAITPSKNLQLETPQQVMARVGNEMTLNKEQWTAYLIIARKFIADLVARSNDQPRAPPVRLLLTGPGGTGKSHVVTTLKKLMAAYGAEHRLRLLAPTGSTAGVIDATTIHKGLGIQVKRKQANNVGDNDAVVTISKTKRAKLEEEWADADFIFCDEISMVGSNLNAEFDQMLRLVKRNELWYGGANVVFAGDLAQYPPVRATPLFHSIGPKTGSKTNRDFLARLGRLAWKSFDNVVELCTQNRMKDDPEYAAAVGRLRVRRCTPADVDIFNSRVVRSPSNDNGVVLTLEESMRATTIVRDNKTRMYLNGLKAATSALKENVVMCAARDSRRGGAALQGEEQEAHLLYDFSSTIAQGGLPSFIPLAVGMQVALRQRNISTELKIANGSMGTIVQLFTSKDGSYTFADGAVVHFPNSPLRLSSLPIGCIYLEPHSVSYQAKKGKGAEGFTRKQLPIEPAFAVTGHFSQGKTLPVVVADLRQGGSAAYVAASRPTSRHGLFLLRPLRLHDLNNPHLPPELLKEFRRLDALKHNTLVQHGFLEAALKEVPDAERDREITEKEHGEVPTKKRKRSDQEKGGEMHSQQSKRRKREDKPPTFKPSTRNRLHPSPFTPVYPYPYLDWNCVDYSCPYDSLLTPLYCAWMLLSGERRHALATYSQPLSQVLDDLKLVDNAVEEAKQNLLHLARERLRDALASSEHGELFPRRGHAFAGVEDIIHALGLNTNQTVQLGRRCHCGFTIGGQNERTEVSEEILQREFLSGTISCLGETPPDVVTVQDWINAQLTSYHGALHRICTQCEDVSQQTVILQLVSPAPLIVIHTQSLAPRLQPSLTFQLPTDADPDDVKYMLVGIIYYGSNHFTARMLLEDGCWEYDGMHGRPVFAGRVSETAAFCESLSTLQGRMATHFVYIRHAGNP